MKIKFSLIIVCFILVFSLFLCACSKQEETDSKNEANTEISTTQQITEAEDESVSSENASENVTFEDGKSEDYIITGDSASSEGTDNVSDSTHSGASNEETPEVSDIDENEVKVEVELDFSELE